MSDPQESDVVPAPASEAAAPSEPTSTTEPTSGGPISLARIRELRKSQEQVAKPADRAPRRDRQQVVAASSAPKAESEGEAADANAGETSGSGSAASSGDRKKPRDDRRDKRGPRRDTSSQEPISFVSKVAVPSIRQPLPDDLEAEINAALVGDDLDKLLIGDDMLQLSHTLEEGQRVQATVVKIHGEHVFLTLGGPNEGMIPKLQFGESLPEIGAQLEVIVRGYLPQEGLYELTNPGNAISVADWSDLREGEIVEAVITGANTGGLECKVGSIEGFIPISQIAEYRVENTAEFVGQKALCVVTEANPRRGNLVLSRRAVLERDKEEKKQQRLAALEIGAAVDGIVRKIMDFGAFVDIGGLDGLLHISQLSYERVKHPSEILTEGQKIQVRVDKIDPVTGKIGLSYRSLQDHPWTDIETRFPIGAVVKGAVTRIAEFGAFVRLATGIEGLVHLSELAHHRVQRVSNVVQEGQEVEVKVLSVEPEKQRISLSLKAAQAAPVKEQAPEVEVEEEAPKPMLPKHRGPLKGGFARPAGGDQFGLKW
jgi:predicted RNA-binding protein with RPS1 domain